MLLNISIKYMGVGRNDAQFGAHPRRNFNYNICPEKLRKHLHEHICHHQSYSSSPSLQNISSYIDE